MEWVHTDLELMLITDTWYDVAEALWRVATILIMKLGGKWHRLVQPSSLPYSVIISISQLVSTSLLICVLNLTQGGQSWLSVISKFPNKTGKFSPLYTKVIQTMILITLSYVLLGPTLVWECHDVHRERRRV